MARPTHEISIGGWVSGYDRVTEKPFRPPVHCRVCGRSLVAARQRHRPPKPPYPIPHTPDGHLPKMVCNGREICDRTLVFDLAEDAKTEEVGAGYLSTGRSSARSHS